MENQFSEEYLKLEIQHHHLHKKTTLSMIIMTISIFVFAGLITSVWDHWLIDVFAYSSSIPFFIYFIKTLIIEEKMKKMVPKREYIDIQENEKHFKRIIKLFEALIATSLISFIVLGVISFLHNHEWISYRVENWEPIAIFAILSFLGFVTAWNYAHHLRKQYLRVKKD